MQAAQRTDDAWSRPERQLTVIEDGRPGASGPRQAAPVEQRDVVHKRIYEDKTFATIAEEQGFSPSAPSCSRNAQAALKNLAGALPPE